MSFDNSQPFRLASICSGIIGRIGRISNGDLFATITRLFRYIMSNNKLPNKHLVVLQTCDVRLACLFNRLSMMCDAKVNQEDVCAW